MPLRLTGRHVEITEALRDYVQERTDRYQKFHVRISSVEVTLTKEKHYHEADIVVKAGRSEYRSSVRNMDLRIAVDEASDRIIKQMERKKGRIIRGKKGAAAIPGRETDNVASFVQPAGLPAWIHPEQIEIASLTVEEALRRLETIKDRDFHVFRNAQNGVVSIIFKDNTGKIGLIEAEAR